MLAVFIQFGENFASILFVELCRLKHLFSAWTGIDDGVEEKSAEDFGVLFVSILVS